MIRSVTIRCSVALLLCLSPPVLADTLELSVFGVYRVGGGIDDIDRDEGEADLETGNALGVGAALAFPLYRRLRLELLFSRQPGELETDAGFLEPADRLAEVDVDYYHLGVSWDEVIGRSRPFFGAGLGATVFETRGDALDDESRFSLSLGGGVRYALGDALALRLEARLYSTWIDSDERLFCGRIRCYRYRDDESMEQLELSLGLTFGIPLPRTSSPP